VGDLTNVGSYTGAASPYGTFDQAGNVWEWNETTIAGSQRGLRGGSMANLPAFFASSSRGSLSPADEDPQVGLRISRVVPVPEPNAALMLVTGSLLIRLLVARREKFGSRVSLDVPSMKRG
jgi:hypothetical protein